MATFPNAISLQSSAEAKLLRAAQLLPDLDAAAFNLRCSLAGAALSDAQYAAVNLFCRRVKNAGLWSRIDELWIMALGQADGVLGLKGRSDLVASGGLTWTPGMGVRGNGTNGFLDTGINPATAIGTNWELNSAAIGAFCLDPTLGSNNRLIGMTNGNLRLVARNATNSAAAGYINDASGADAIDNATTVRRRSSRSCGWVQPTSASSSIGGSRRPSPQHRLRLAVPISRSSGQ